MAMGREMCNLNLFDSPYK